jgi:Flp pilus assembly pilin Flp
MNAMLRLLGKDDGQDLLEYALLVGLIALVATAAVTSVGLTIRDTFWSLIANMMGANA